MKFQCPSCHISFHYKKIHDEQYYELIECPQCKKKFPIDELEKLQNTVQKIDASLEDINNFDEIKNNTEKTLKKHIGLIDCDVDFCILMAIIPLTMGITTFFQLGLNSKNFIKDVSIVVHTCGLAFIMSLCAFVLNKASKDEKRLSMLVSILLMLISGIFFSKNLPILISHFIK